MQMEKLSLANGDRIYRINRIFGISKSTSPNREVSVSRWFTIFVSCQSGASCPNSLPPLHGCGLGHPTRHLHETNQTVRDAASDGQRENRSPKPCARPQFHLMALKRPLAQPTPMMEAEILCVVETGNAQKRGDEDDRRGTRFGGETMDRLQLYHLVAERPDDAPPADGRARRHGEGARDFDQSGNRGALFVSSGP